MKHSYAKYGSCWCLAPVCLLLTGVAYAADPLPVVPVGGWQIAKVAAALLLVVAAIVATAAGLKRLKSIQAAHGSHMRIIDGISVSTRDRIVLLEVDEQRLLVGISPGRIERLHVFERPHAPGFDELVRQAGAQTSAAAEADI